MIFITACTRVRSQLQTCFMFIFMMVLTLYHNVRSLSPFSYSSYLNNDHWSLASAATGNDNGTATAATSTSLSSTKNGLRRQQHQHDQDDVFNFTSIYEPSGIERWLIDQPENGRKFNFHHNTKLRNRMADGCAIYHDPNSSPYYNQLQHFRTELHNYARILDTFLNNTQHQQQTDRQQQVPPRDLRRQIEADGGHHDICNSLELHPNGLPGIFAKSGMLSKVPFGGGYVEPLITPMRHLEHCYAGDYLHSSPFVMDMHYLIHDFASLCRKLQPKSRTIFVDMGAALDFHDKSHLAPAVYVTHVYQAFGFKFDHIYAYEVQPKSPQDVYKRIPDDLKAAYHWYNVGVNASITSSSNPLKMILENYNEDDFIVVKLGTSLFLKQLKPFQPPPLSKTSCQCL
jgi:hypothetical protein